MRREFTTRCHAVEATYEFMLAYAARGVTADDASTRELREHLERAVEALTGIGALLGRIVDDEGLQPAARYEGFRHVLDRDVDAALAAMHLVMAQPSISSQLVDNLNASIHVRALLTDLFLIDEILAPQIISAALPDTSPP